jgi:hypothetical protein
MGYTSSFLSEGVPYSPSAAGVYDVMIPFHLFIFKGNTNITKRSLAIGGYRWHG